MYCLIKINYSIFSVSTLNDAFIRDVVQYNLLQSKQHLLHIYWIFFSSTQNTYTVIIKTQNVHTAQVLSQKPC